MIFCDACNNEIKEHEVGGKMVTTRPHEIRTRGAGGKCVKENQLRLCKQCHDLFHEKGWRFFIYVFPDLAYKIYQAFKIEPEQVDEGQFIDEKLVGEYV